MPEPENAFNMRNESDEDDMSWQSFTPFFVMWPKEYIHGLFSPFRISKGCKQMCFNRYYASFLLPRWSFLFPIEAAI